MSVQCNGEEGKQEEAYARPDVRKSLWVDASHARAAVCGGEAGHGECGKGQRRRFEVRR
jgi:hypothetical protein